jgi:Domain of Unknown Function (DUF1080)
MSSPNRICPQCGIPLASNEMFCNNCGARYTEQAVGEPAQYASSSSSPSYNSSPFDNTDYGSARQSSSPAASSPSAQIPGVYGQPSQMTNGYNQAPSRKSLNRGFVIGIILLLALVVGGGIFFFVKSKGSNSNVTGNGSTTVPARSATTISTSTPLFSDNFADNSKGWGLASSSGYSSTISNNMMTLADSNHKILDMAIPTGNNAPATYSDFEVSTTLTLLKADQNDSAGLYVRGDSNLVQGYFIDIFGDNSFDIVKIFADSSKDTFLVSPTNSSAINPVGQQNKLTVVTKGSKIVVLINNKVVSSISDTNGYASGTIELFVENGRSSNGAQASFSNVAVYPAPGRLPA